jgi:hypothetical protein
METNWKIKGGENILHPGKSLTCRGEYDLILAKT